MKTSWERSEGSKNCYVYINANEVVIGSHYGSGHSDNATSCSYSDFLAGKHHGLVLDDFGNEILHEITAYVKKAANFGPFNKQREKADILKKFIYDIPKNSSIKKMINSSSLINGFKYYGNAGGYNTELKTAEYRFFVDCSNPSHIRGSITHLRTRDTYHFSLVGYCSSVVLLKNNFYIVCLDNFSVLNSKGVHLYSTSLLEDENGEKIFGEELRVSRTLRYKNAILVQCWWVSADDPDVYLKFDIKKKRFTGRWNRDQ
ncbi:MAG: hypothetical protein GY754_07445 [bacterium]|nr:hypothetical protein [bacterium]